MIDVADKIALVTGAASDPGLGSATARMLARAGASVFVTDVDEAGAEACADRIRADGGTATALRHDIAADDDWTRVVAAVIAAHGRLDIVVNNAGIAVIAPIDRITPEQFLRQQEVNLLGTFLGTRHAARGGGHAGGRRRRDRQHLPGGGDRGLSRHHRLCRQQGAASGC